MILPCVDRLGRPHERELHACAPDVTASPWASTPPEVRDGWPDELAYHSWARPIRRKPLLRRGK